MAKTSKKPAKKKPAATKAAKPKKAPAAPKSSAKSVTAAAPSRIWRASSCRCRIQSTSGSTTYDAKDPNTKYPPITELRPPKGAPNVLIVLIDDVGFGASSAFGGPCQTPVIDRLAAEGLEAQPLSHDGVVLTHPSGAADRPQPPLRRHGCDHRNGHLGAGQQQHPAQGKGAGRRNLAAQRVLDRSVRKVPRGSAVGSVPRRTLPPVAHRFGLRVLLRLRRRRGQPVLPRTVRGHNGHRAAEDSRGGLHPHRGSGRPGHHLGPSAEGADARQAVLHVLGARCHPRPAPRTEGVVGQVQGQVRRRLGCVARKTIAQAEEAGRGAQGCRTHRTSRADSGVGRHAG